MRKLRSMWQGAFDVREGERARASLMFLYLLLVLFTHYILKPISRGMFVARFDIDRLPYLYILIAIVGGVLATLYTKAAVRASLQAAVAWAMSISLLAFLSFWWLFQYRWAWLLYAFNLWGSLFGTVLVAQGWLIASNVFTSREAKRLYGLIGLGAVAGGWIGSVVTTLLVKRFGPRPLVLACAFLVIVAYACFRLLATQKGVTLAGARAAEEEEARFRVRDILGDVTRNRHLAVITGIITLTYIVDQFVEYQFQAAGKLVYGSDERSLSAFLGGYNLCQNVVTFILQGVVTGLVVSRLGVGGTLQVMPVSISLASLAALAWPGILSAAAARLTEAASRYSFNRTGMELLYLPLPAELRNRTKAFVDVFVDRMGRGLAGMLLIALGWAGLKDVRNLPLVVLVFTLSWVLLSWRAKKEYMLTIRKRLHSRRLELESARVTVSDPATLALLEQVAVGANARQACYALSVLADAPDYDLLPLLRTLAASPLPAVRSKVYDLARSLKSPELLSPALAEIRAADEASQAATAYALTVSPEARRLAQEFLENRRLTESTLEAMTVLGDAACELVSPQWIQDNTGHADPDRRRMAALAVGVHGDQGIAALHRLLEDPDPQVVIAACRAVGTLKSRTYLAALLPRLEEPRLRGPAIEALAACGARIAGALGDHLEDTAVPPAIRRQIPRVLRLVADQRSVEVLLRAVADPDLSVRLAVLKALNRLRETAPQLNYGPAFVTKAILAEARHYFELHANLAPLRAAQAPRTAVGLLARTLEERLHLTIERLFRLLGLRYPPREIYASYLKVRQGRASELAAALEFLDNVLDHDLKRAVLPLVEAPASLRDKGRDLFGIQPCDAEGALRELLASPDPWLVACAAAAAAELGLRNLAPQIAEAARRARPDVAQVAGAALATLA